MPVSLTSARPATPRRARVAASAAALTVLLGVLAAVPSAGFAATAVRATAAAPLPATPWFPSWIDAYPRWEPETGCDPVAKPGPLAVTALLKNTYGAIGSNIVRACTGADSGHEEGRAIDWMTSVHQPAQKAMAEAFVGWLQADDQYGNHHAAARRLGIMYVIWNSRIFSLYSVNSGWREYSGCLTKRTAVSDDTACHRDHVHLSFSWAGARKQTSWWTLADTPICQKLTALPTPAARSGRPTGRPQPVVPTTVLDTVNGQGTPAAGVPCRSDAQGSVLDIKVSGLGAVPADVGEVRMNVIVTAGAKAATVGVFSPRAGLGSAGMAPVTAMAGSTATGTWDVPVGAPGHILLRVTPAGTQVSATVGAVRLVKKQT